MSDSVDPQADPQIDSPPPLEVPEDVPSHFELRLQSPVPLDIDSNILNVNFDTTIRQIKETVRDRFRCKQNAPSLDRQRIIYSGQQLEDEDTLKQVLKTDTLPNYVISFIVVIKPIDYKESPQAQQSTSFRSFFNRSNSHVVTEPMQATDETNDEIVHDTSLPAHHELDPNATTPLEIPIPDDNRPVHTIPQLLTNSNVPFDIKSKDEIVTHLGVSYDLVEIDGQKFLVKQNKLGTRTIHIKLPIKESDDNDEIKHKTIILSSSQIHFYKNGPSKPIVLLSPSGIAALKQNGVNVQPSNLVHESRATNGPIDIIGNNGNGSSLPRNTEVVLRRLYRIGNHPFLNQQNFLQVPPQTNNNQPPQNNRVINWDNLIARQRELREWFGRQGGLIWGLFRISTLILFLSLELDPRSMGYTQYFGIITSIIVIGLWQLNIFTFLEARIRANIAGNERGRLGFMRHYMELTDYIRTSSIRIANFLVAFGIGPRFQPREVEDNVAEIQENGNENENENEENEVGIGNQDNYNEIDRNLDQSEEINGGAPTDNNEPVQGDEQIEESLWKTLGRDAFLFFATMVPGYYDDYKQELARRMEVQRRMN